jgi:hypothetical protein
MASFAGVLILLYTVGTSLLDRPERQPQTGGISSRAAATPMSPSASVSPATSSDSPVPINGQTSNATTDKSPNPSGQEIEYLADVTPVPTSGRRYDTGTQRVDASVYPHSLYALSCPNCYVVSPEYDLGRSWKTFRPTVGIISDDSEASVVLQFEVFADGRRVGTAHRLGLGQHLEVAEDISGTLRLELVLTRVSGAGQARGVWGDATLSR